jgi:glutamyl-tRNA reductase
VVTPESIHLTGHDQTLYGEDCELVVLGINYHSTPISVRERFIIPEYCLNHALAALARLPHIKEAVVLSTCNRTEVYAVVSNLQAGLNEIETFFVSTQTISDHEVLRPNFKLLGDDVVLHLLRVASGLDSLVLGEGQIMSQVKTAHRIALSSETAGPVLSELFKRALNCGKRVRTETSMARRAVSVSSAAVELAREVLGSLKDKTILIIGAGRMARICAKHILSESGNGAVIMVNRSSDKLTRFTEDKLPNKHRLNTKFAFEDRHQLASNADLVIVSTGAPDYLLTARELANLNRSKQVCIIDISVPRNIDPDIGILPNVQLYHCDQIADIVNRNQLEREALVKDAEKIVFEALSQFHDWQRAQMAAPTIARLRRKVESIRQEQVGKNNALYSAQEEEFAQYLEQVSRAIVNQILHHPTIKLKATDDRKLLKQQAEALQTLFNLDVFSAPTNAELNNYELNDGNDWDAEYSEFCEKIAGHGDNEIDLNKLASSAKVQ